MGNDKSKEVDRKTAVSKRTYLKQTDVPSATIEEALRVPEAILAHYAGRPTSPLQVAKALNIDPQGSQLRVLTGAAIAYGLIEGGAQAATISITELARRILRPTEEGVDLSAKREAVLQPRVLGEFLEQYDGHPLPRSDIAENVLEGMGVPRERTLDVFAMIETNARSVRFLEDIKNKIYVNLRNAVIVDPGDIVDSQAKTAPSLGKEISSPTSTHHPVKPTHASERYSSLAAAIVDDARRRRVFITHGKNQELVDPIRKLLEYGEMEPVISIERQSVSKPVPEKVMDDMRNCGAAIIHIAVDRTITDKEGNDHPILNPNVLIEIGAAMAFYGQRFILLVQEGVKLPSNLQGLYEVRYTGETLDAVSTIRLLEAIKDIKNYKLPGERPEDEN